MAYIAPMCLEKSGLISSHIEGAGSGQVARWDVLMIDIEYGWLVGI